MRFELLGPVSVVTGGARHSIPRAQTRGVLALLLLGAGRTVTPDAAIEAIWAGAEPSTARAQIHNAVRDIRKHLSRLGAGEVIVTERYGYRADVDPADVDVLLFERRVQQAGEAGRGGDHPEASRLLRAALDLWAGDPLQGVSGAYAEPARARLVDLRLAAIEDLADLELRHGRPELVAAELTPLVHAYPLRERLRTRLMTALYHSGRQAEALRSARQYRALLAEQEGLDPGPEILEAEATIRRADDAPAAGAPVAAAPVRVRPAQLPAVPAGFVARGAESAVLDQVCLDGTSPRVVALVGPGGAGKTALAVHWAYQRLDDFDGGQLYVNLHGFGLEPEVDAFEALGQLLRGLGQPNHALPGSVDERAAQFRSLVAGARMLIVLDNAAGSAQVRPLLPGVGPHLTLITSRRRLDSLATGDGLRQIAVEPLPQTDAVSLLRRHVDPGRTGDVLLAEVSRLSGGLPLALRILAARLATTSADGMEALVADLADERRRLAALSMPSEDTAVRGAFASSYQALSSPGRRMFRLLGLLPDAETSAAACAAAAGIAVAEVLPLLDELHACHLAQRTAAGRYQVHDLIRLYARELVAQEDPLDQRDAAERRLCDWYLLAATAADEAIRPHDRPFPGEPGDLEVPSFPDAAAALAWFDTEAGSLLPVVARAEHLHPDACWRLAAVMFGWLERHQRRTSWVPVCEAGARAAAAVGDREGLALIRHTLAIFDCQLRRFDQAVEAFGEVLAIRREIGPPRRLATTLMNLGNVYAETGRDADALPCFAEALALLEDVPDALVLRGAAYDNLGWAHRVAKRYDQAIECHTRAIEITRECGDAQSLSYAEGNLAAVLSDCDRHDEAAAHWQSAIDYAHNSGDLRLVADGLAGRGRARTRLGDHDAARKDLADALATYRMIGSDRATEVAELLATVPVG